MIRVLALTFVLLAACEDSAVPKRIGHYVTPTAHGLPAQALPGGDTTSVALKPGTALSEHAFSQAASNLPASKRGLFTVGNSFFSSPWVIAPASVSARDGLGPLYAAAACQDCHLRDGRGALPQTAADTFRAAVLRIVTRQGAPHPIYGHHLQLHAIPGVVPEVDARVDWIVSEARLPDGSVVPLRRPQARIRRWNYGAAGEAVIGLRIAPPMIGLGLLEAIADKDIEAQQTIGRVNRVPDRSSGQKTIGRFGWKATQADVRQQVLDAFVNDIGITSTLFPNETCTPAQTACAAAASGGRPELETTVADAVVFYARHLAPPARRDYDRPDVIAGEKNFHQLGCAGCHRPQWKTGRRDDSPELSEQIIFPYTDLQLHDMGPGLADGIREHEAGPQDWRTPPLWGLGHTRTVSGADAGYLHDGRARDLAEAILWHGGNAQAARDSWAALPKDERRKLIRFLASL